MFRVHTRVVGGCIKHIINVNIFLLLIYIDTYRRNKVWIKTRINGQGHNFDDFITFCTSFFDKTVKIHFNRIPFISILVVCARWCQTIWSCLGTHDSWWSNRTFCIVVFRNAVFIVFNFFSTVTISRQLKIIIVEHCIGTKEALRRIYINPTMSNNKL